MIAPLLTALLLHAAPAEISEPTSRVYAGVFLRDVSGFDLKEGRFHADLELWLKWSGPVEVPPLSFLNGELATREVVARESEGDWHSVRWRVQGTFRGTFPLQAFPFDQQTIKVELGLPRAYGELVPDLASSGMSESFSITGWQYEPFFQTERRTTRRASDFGSISREGSPQVEESVAFAVTLARPYAAYVFKFMLPLAVILGMAFLVFFLPGELVEGRCAMGVTALLSVVAFHFAMSSTIPDVPYLVGADRLFLWAYGLVLGSVVTSVVVFNQREGRPRLARWLDRGACGLFSLVACAAGLMVATPSQQSAMAEADLQPAAAALAAGDDDAELRVGITNIPTLSAPPPVALTRRGMAGKSESGPDQPHLVVALPEMTNSHVRLLPDGGMWVRWQLRPELRWSDGEPLTAQDVIFSLELTENPDRIALVAADETTVEVTYSRRLPEHLTPFRVYPRHVLAEKAAVGREEVFAHMRETPTPGDGPYRVHTYRPGEALVFERNPYFAGQRPAIGRVRFVPTRTGARKAFEAGEIDLVANLSDESHAALEELGGLVLHQRSGETLLALAPDLNLPAFADVRTRRAMLRTLDRVSVTREAYGSAGTLASSFRHPSQQDAAPDLNLDPEDLPGALALISEAGLNGPVEVPLYVLEHKETGNYGRALRRIREDLARIGIQATITPLKPAELTSRVTGATHGGIVLTQIDTSGVAGRVFNLPLVNGRYDVNTVRPHFDLETSTLYARMEGTLFEERRRVLSVALQRRWAQALPIIPIAFSGPGLAHRRALRGPPATTPAAPYWNVETWRFVKEDEQ